MKNLNNKFVFFGQKAAAKIVHVSGPSQSLRLHEGVPADRNSVHLSEKS